MDKKISVISDLDGKKIVVISDIRFKGKRNINWEEVEQYLKEYIGDCYEVVETSDQVYIGSDFPGELKGSEDTKRLYGANAKAKANATQGIPMLLQCATNKRWQENFKGKHNVDAKFGWYRFTTRFALPVYNNDTGDLERFNIFRIEMLIRHAADGNLYLYDMVNIKKETSTPLEQQLYGNKPISLYRILLYLMINVNCIRRSRRNMTSSCTSMVSEV